MRLKKFRHIFISLLFLQHFAGYSQEVTSITSRDVPDVEGEVGLRHDSLGNSIVAGDAHVPSGGGGGGGSAKNVFVSKYDSLGNFLWTNHTMISMSSQSAYFKDLEVDSEGNTYVWGDFQGSTFTWSNRSLQGQTSGTLDVYLAKISPHGIMRWIKGVDMAASDTAQRMAGVMKATSDGHLLVTGFFMGDMTLGGKSVSGSPSELTVFYAKLATNGTAVWLKKAERLMADTYHAPNTITNIAEGPYGNLFMTLSLDSALIFGNDTISSHGPATANLTAVAKFDDNGDLLDYKVLESPSNRISDITIDHCGNPMILGTYQNSLQIDQESLSAQSQQDVFIAKFESGLTARWLKDFSTDQPDKASGLQCNDQNDVFFAMELWGDLDLNGSVHNSAGGDLALIKLDTAGSYLWHTYSTGQGMGYSPEVSVSQNKHITLLAKYTGVEGFGNLSVSNSRTDILVANFRDTAYTGGAANCSENIGREEAAHAAMPTVFPNPASNSLYVELEEAQVAYKILNLQGAVVKEGFTEGSRSRIDISALAEGVYLLRLEGNAAQSLKFIKE